MKSFVALSSLLLVLGLQLASSYELDGDDSAELRDFFEDDRFIGRTFYPFNDTATILVAVAVGALIVVGIGVALYLYEGGEFTRSDTVGGEVPNSQYAYSEYYYPNTADAYSAYAQGQQQPYQQYQQRRSADGFDFNSLNVIQWISMLQDIYEKFDYNDLECQKRLICEVMKEPTYYGSAAQKFKTGFQYAKYLEVLSLPDDMRDLLDEYLDANSAAEMNKECNEFFTCPFSIKDSFKRNLSGNSL